MSSELSDLRERMSKLSDADLLRMVNIEYKDFRAEALDIANEEIERRGILQYVSDNIVSPIDQRVSPIRAEMSLKVTYLLAAELISRSNFPNKHSLPTLYPPAFNNFGHQPIMNYELLLKIIWEVIEEIKLSAERQEKRRLPWILGSVVAALILLALGVFNEFPPLIFIAFVTSFILFYIGLQRIRKSIKKDVAEIRVKAIKQLVSLRWESNNAKVNRTIARELRRVGSGILGDEKIPVITVISNEQPFTGYGRLQAENLFICRPKEKDRGTLPSIDDIRKVVSNNITNKVMGLDIKEAAFGEVVVVHGDSLTIESKWLDEDKVPVLWIGKSELCDIQLIDPQASTRNYFAIQLLFPQYMTAATFFTRLFWAGNSASCQVAVTTLGPPTVDTDYLHSRLRKHEIEEDEEDYKIYLEKFNTNTNDEKAEAIRYLRFVRLWGRDKSPFQPDLNIKEIEKLSISSEKEATYGEYEEEYKKIIKESAVWPGRYYKASPNWRENNSLTFTTDFFGRPEIIASVKTLYDQISRAVLDTLDTLGFDISDYRDSEGNYSINAEKIDQLVIGETIHIKESKEPKKPDSD